MQITPSSLSQKQQGISLLEIIISTAIFASLAIMITLSLSSLVKRQGLNNQISHASAELQQTVEQVHGAALTDAYDDLTIGGGSYYISATSDAWQVETSPPSGAEYDTEVNIIPAYKDTNGIIDPNCTAATSDCILDPNVKQAHITLNWSTNPGPPLTTTTFLSKITEPNIDIPLPPPVNVNVNNPTGANTLPEISPIIETTSVFVPGTPPDTEYLYEITVPGEYYVKTWGNNNALDTEASILPTGAGSIIEGPYTPEPGSRPNPFFSKFEFTTVPSTIQTEYPHGVFRCLSNCTSPPISISPWTYTRFPNPGEPLYVDYQVSNAPLQSLTNIHYVILDHADGEEDVDEYTATREIFFYEEGNIANRYETVNIPPISSDIAADNFTINEPGNTNRLMLRSIDSAVIWIETNVPAGPCDVTAGDC